MTVQFNELLRNKRNDDAPGIRTYILIVVGPPTMSADQEPDNDLAAFGYCGPSNHDAPLPARNALYLCKAVVDSKGYSRVRVLAVGYFLNE